jgi:hypothetical protein
MKFKLTKFARGFTALLLAAVVTMFFFMGTGLGKENFVQIKSRIIANKCIDSGKDDVYVADCGFFSGQQWSVDGTPEDVYHKVQNEFAGKSKCLTIDPNSTPKRVYMGNCNGAEKWKLKDGKLEANTIMYGVPECLSSSGKDVTLDACFRLKPTWKTVANN